jgi:hypothetical protein
VFIINGGLFIMQWLIKRWSSWQNEIALWMNSRGFDEERDASRGFQREDQQEVITDSYRRRTSEDLESLEMGTRVY